jgi:uncharacterized membrane protein
VAQAEVTVTIRAPADAVFNFVAEPANTPRFMSGISRYDPIGAKDRGKGAVLLSTANVAGKSFDVELVITSWKEHEMMVATSRKGPKTQGSWRFEEYDDGTTDATLLYEYELPLVFKFVPGASRIIESNMEKSLRKLKQLVEAEARRPRRAKSGG